jgi:hypothetical protein
LRVLMANHADYGADAVAEDERGFAADAIG